MAEVHLRVGEHEFSMRCRDDEKAALEQVGRLLDKHWAAAARAAGSAGPFRVMLLAALLMGAELIAARAPTAGTVDLDSLADRIERIAAALEEGTARA